MTDKKDNERKGSKPEIVTLETKVLSGHKHLFNKLCEEKMLMEGKEASSVVARMIYKEACEIFGEEKTMRIINNYYFGSSPQ